LVLVFSLVVYFITPIGINFSRTDSPLVIV
jgi:hypothetical protein